MTRRTQQFTCYDAETRADIAMATTGRNPTLPSLNEAQVVLDDWLSNGAWWEAESGGEVHRVEVHPADRGADSSCARYDRDARCGRIWLLPAQTDKLTLCHELAHVFMSARGNNAGYDPAWARMYLRIVWLTMGSEAYKILFDAFRDSHVEIG